MYTRPSPSMLPQAAVGGCGIWATHFIAMLAYDPGANAAGLTILLRGDLHGPEAFMPVAERFDLTEAIDRWVLRRALDLQRDPAGAGRCLAVNLSARSIGPEVAELLERELAAGDLDPSLLITVMRHGLTLAGRYLVARTRIPDRPGELVKGGSSAPLAPVDFASRLRLDRSVGRAWIPQIAWMAGGIVLILTLLLVPSVRQAVANVLAVAGIRFEFGETPDLPPPATIAPGDKVAWMGVLGSYASEVVVPAASAGVLSGRMPVFCQHTLSPREFCSRTRGALAT